MSAQSRAHGALLGLAIGDALGMPTQYQPRALIAGRYGILDRFQPGPDDNFISRGMAAGRVTDDTDQAVILGELLVEGDSCQQIRNGPISRLLCDMMRRLTGSAV